MPTTTTSAVDQLAVAEAHAGDPAVVALDRRDLSRRSARRHRCGRAPCATTLAHLGAEAAHQRRRGAFQDGDASNRVWAAVAATSRPMKPAPITTTRGPIGEAATQRERVVERAQHRHAVEVGLAGQRSRCAAGGDDHAVADDDLAGPEGHRPVRRRRAPWR